jgi:two-component system, NarL family, nitrate/nitrite response regulator NarL
MTTILIAEDNARFRIILKALLITKQNWTIIGEACNGEEAVRLAKVRCPDIAILDITMPVLDGVHAAEKIAALCPRVLILTESLHDTQQLFAVLQRAGIRGFVSKMDVAQDLIPAIESILEGHTWYRHDAARSAN